MLRTNSKKAIENVENYILNNADFDNYKNCGGYELVNRILTEYRNGERDDKYIILGNIYLAIRHIVYTEIQKYTRQYYLLSDFNAFDEWVRGLPSALDCEFMCRGSAVDLVGEILEETETEKARYTECEAEKMMIKLLFKVIYER